MSYCASSVSEVKASSSVGRLDRVYKRDWFSKEPLKVAYWGTEQRVPNKHNSFYAAYWKHKGQPCHLPVRSPESPQGQVDVFIPGLQGRSNLRNRKETRPDLEARRLECLVSMPGSGSLRRMLSSPSQWLFSRTKFSTDCEEGTNSP